MAALCRRARRRRHMLVAGAEPGDRRHAARRCGPDPHRLCDWHRGHQAARRRPRPHLRRDVPDPRFDPVLGAVRTGGFVAQSLHRPLCRPRRGAGFGVPVGQRHLHRPARAAVRGAVDLARPQGHGAIDAGEVRSCDASARPRLLCPQMGCGRGRHGKCDAGAFHLPHLSVPYDRRTVPLARRPQRDEPAGSRRIWRR